MNWRHRTGLVTQWNRYWPRGRWDNTCSLHLTCRVNLALLAHQLKFMYGGKLPAVQLPREDQELVPESMTRECVAQASFRLLTDHCTGKASCHICIMSHVHHVYLQVFEQSWQPSGAEQTGQGVPDATVLPVRHRVGQCDRPNSSSLPPLPAYHLL